MYANEFEQKLKDLGFYLESPSFFIPGSNKDAEGYMPEQMLDIIGHDKDKFSSLVRRRSEQVGMLTYYLKDTLGVVYFKVLAQTSATMQTGGNPMEMPKIPEWAKNIAMHAVSGFVLGFGSTFVAQPGSWSEFSNAFYGAAVIGLYGAFKEVLAYIPTLLPKPVTNAGAPTAAPTADGKKLHERML
jgi:hypothetical protein